MPEMCQPELYQQLALLLASLLRLTKANMNPFQQRGRGPLTRAGGLYFGIEKKGIPPRTIAFRTSLLLYHCMHVLFLGGHLCQQLLFKKVVDINTFNYTYNPNPNPRPIKPSQPTQAQFLASRTQSAPQPLPRTSGKLYGL